MSLIQDAKTSLSAINTWMNVIQANLEGTRATAYKSNRVSFTSNNNIGPLGTNMSARPGATNGNSILPSASLLISQTSSDFSQGELIATDEELDLAINGDGFFLLRAGLESSDPIYISRDGQFHWNDEGMLVNKDGLYVLDNTAIVDPGIAPNPTMPIYTEPGEAGEWDCRDELMVTNPDPLFPLPVGARISLTFDATKYINAGKMQSDLDDLRITYWDGANWQVQQIDIDLTGGLTAAKIYWQTPFAIPAGGSVTGYYLQYCNPLAGPGNATDTLNFLDPAYSDNFNDGVPNPNWQSVNGWVIQESDRVGTTADDPDFEFWDATSNGVNERAVLNEPGSNLWSDYRFQVTMGTYSTDDDAAHVYFRWNEATQTGYRFVLSAGGNEANTDPNAFRRVEKIVGGVVVGNVFADSFLPAGIVIPPNPPNAQFPFNDDVAQPWTYDLDIQVRGNEIRLFLGGVLVLNAQDTLPGGPILQGTVGLGGNGDFNWFDDMSVSATLDAFATIIGQNGTIGKGQVGAGSNPATWEAFIQQKIAIIRPDNPNGLIYSQYGATVFDVQKSQAGRYKLGMSGQDGLGVVRTSRYEASNASFTEFLPMLSSAQKLFAAISKLISIHNGQLDEVNQLIR